ncbi:hypothetical protein [Burkholderia cenocepacia]|uniref:hypothetical protein n=1 Tax=Burkholderia cenocepacia TaxID=95486 RepID=UPI001177E123|nr:hypothetical protein [Burkholderia cenocepacia]
MSVSATPLLVNKTCFIQTRDAGFLVKITGVKDIFIQGILMKNVSSEGDKKSTYAPTGRTVLFSIHNITYIEIYENNIDIPTITTNY